MLFLGDMFGSLAKLLLQGLATPIFRLLIAPTFTLFVDELLWHEVYIEGIFKPFTRDILGVFVDQSMQALEFNFVNILFERVRVVAMAIFVLILAFQVFKAMFAHLGFEIEEPWKIGLKAIIFGFLLFYSKDLCQLIVSLFAGFNSFIGEHDTFASAVASLAEQWKQTSLLTIVGIFCLYASIKFIFLAFRFAERYVITIVLTIVSPLAFACGTNKSTRPYLQGWVKAFAGNLLVQMFQLIMVTAMLLFFRLDASSHNSQWFMGSIHSPDGVFSWTDYFTVSGGNNVIALLVIIALLQITEKAEDLMKEIGIGVAAQFGPLMGPVNLLQSISSPIWSLEAVGRMLGAGIGANAAGVAQQAAMQRVPGR